MGAWLLVTYLMSAGCHADGPMIRYGHTYCREREILCIESARFRTEESCLAEARQRWSESGYRTASRCTRTR